MLEHEPAPPGISARRRARLATLPWRDMPGPMRLLIVANLLLLLPLPFLWPALFGLSPAPGGPGSAARQIGVAAEQKRPHMEINSRAAQAEEQRSARGLLIGADTMHWSPRFGVSEAAEELERQPFSSLVPGEQERRQLAEALVGQSIRWGINPQVLLVLLEQQAAPRGGTVPLSGSETLSSSELEQSIADTARRLRAGMLEEPPATLELHDGFDYLLPEDIDQASYALLKVLAQRAGRQRLQLLLSGAAGSFTAAFERRFVDPRRDRRARLSDAPFLQQPFDRPYAASAQFDHHYPTFAKDGTVVTAPGTAGLGYDGHNGWDYPMPEGVAIRAAADGYVLFAGTMDNECATRAGAVAIEHSNGYRTLYWHLRHITVAPGDQVNAGDLLGSNGATGCASGPHLHFGVQRLGRDVDPYGWCGPEPDPWAQHPAGARSVALWVDRPSTCPLPSGASIADEQDATAALLLGKGWYASAGGNSGSAHYTYVREGAAQATAIWRPHIPRSGRYRCFAFLPGSAADATLATYHITTAGGKHRVAIDQSRMAGSWANLGAYSFAAGQLGRIELRDNDGDAGEKLWADAVACAAEP